MNKTIYRQYDNRWRWLPYPNGGYYLNGSGCGCCAVTHCIIEMDKYKKWTPANVQPYMKQFAVRGNGTLWNGILTSLKHYGLKDVENIPTMAKLWKELAKGNRVGVLLFGNTKGPDGTVWTTGGHYIAFTGYKVKNGKHYLYLKDSGGRKHDGWYCYEKSMKGDVRQVWIGRIPKGSEITDPFKASLSKEGYTGKLPSKAVSRKKGSTSDIKKWQKFLNWWYKFKLTVDGDFGNKTESATKDFQAAHGLDADGAVGPKTLAKAEKYLKKEDSSDDSKKETKKETTQTTTQTTAQTTAQTTTSTAPAPSTSEKKEKAEVKKTTQQKMTEWAKKTADKKYHYVVFSSKKASQTCPICKGRKYDNYYGWNCIGFAFAVWHHGGKLKSKCNCGVIDNGTANKILKASKTKALTMARNKIGINKIKVIRNNKKAIPLSKLQEGDIVQFFNGNKYYHTAYYMGDGKIADATRGRSGKSNQIKAGVKLSKTAKKHLKVAYRYTGK